MVNTPGFASWYLATLLANKKGTALALSTDQKKPKHE
jgi:hypothetical protein